LLQIINTLAVKFKVEDFMAKNQLPDTVSVSTELWSLGISELAGRNLETAGREEVNQMLADGWLLLHIYTLKYREDGEWRERPMAILGRSGKSIGNATYKPM
jgi:hypothetical protein